MDALKEKTEYHIVSFSGGKDSTAMVLRMIELGWPLDEVICCDTTMEFPAMYRHIEKVRKVVEDAGIKFTMLKAEKDFEWWLLEYTPEKPGKKRQEMGNPPGFSWATPFVRWCTDKLKGKVVDRYLRDLRGKYELVQYVGIAADELDRLESKSAQNPGLRYPLIEWGWDEAKALEYCYSKGYDWEGLYKIFKRVSCWCCPLQPLEALRKLRLHFPELWERLLYLDNKTWGKFNSHGYSVADLDRRFDLEEALAGIKEKTNNPRFFADLRRCLNNEATIEGIVAERINEKTEKEEVEAWMQ